MLASWIASWSDPSPWIGIAIALLALVAAIYFPVRSLRKAQDANYIARKALAISESELEEREQQRAARARLVVEVFPGPNHETSDDGTIWITGSAVVVTVVIRITNVGDRPAGRTLVDVWLPRAGSGDLFWAWSAGGPAVADLPQGTPDPSVRLNESASAPLFESARLSRTLERVAVGLEEELYVRANFGVEPGDNAYPVDVVVHAESAENAAKKRYVLRIKRR